MHKTKRVLTAIFSTFFTQDFLFVSGMTAQRATIWVVLLVASTAAAAPTEQPPPDVSDLVASPSASPLVTESANKVSPPKHHNPLARR